MNKLWVQLSLASFGMVAITIIGSFTVFFALSWLIDTPYTQEEYVEEFENITMPLATEYIVQGKSDAEILALLDQNERLKQELEILRQEGYASGVDIDDRSLGRISSDYLFELFDPVNQLTLLIGSGIAILMSTFMSRRLTRPLAQLTQASQAFGARNLTEPVTTTIKGSDEIEALTAAFNEMTRQLKEADQSRQNMIADISHELRTPLAGIEGTLRAMLDGVFPMSDHYASNLYAQTRHLTRLVNDLHLLARAEARQLTLEKTAVDLSDLLHDLADLFAPLAQTAEVTLQKEIITISPIEIEGDPGRIRQIVSNLLNNALRHTPANGAITLTLSRAGTNAQIKVSDNGEGILPDHLPHLFERFYRVDQSRSRETGGTGLGLAITKALVDAHEGQLSAISDGEGKRESVCCYTAADACIGGAHRSDAAGGW